MKEGDCNLVLSKTLPPHRPSGVWKEGLTFLQAYSSSKTELLFTALSYVSNTMPGDHEETSVRTKLGKISFSPTPMVYQNNSFIK